MNGSRKGPTEPEDRLRSDGLKTRADTYTIRYGRQMARTPVPVDLASEQRGRLTRIVVNPAHDVLVGDVADTRFPKSQNRSASVNRASISGKLITGVRAPPI
jgi:hypothetical protein